MPKPSLATSAEEADDSEATEVLVESWRAKRLESSLRAPGATRADAFWNASPRAMMDRRRHLIKSMLD